MIHSCRTCEGTGFIDDEHCSSCGGLGKFNLEGP